MESESLENNEDALLTSLAAFLANRLDGSSRSDMMAFLSENPEARELLLMSYELYRANLPPDSGRTSPTGKHPTGEQAGDR